ncbi:MAG: signal peptidase I [Gammaproteobacteria bacterium]
MPQFWRLFRRQLLLGPQAIGVDRTGKWPIAVSIAAAIGLLALFLVWMIDVYIVTTPSMRPALAPGDVVACVRGTSAVAPGDIVAFVLPATSQTGIKRVVALPEDHVMYRNKELVINGVLIAKQLRTQLQDDDPADLQFQQSLLARTFEIYETFGGALDVDVKQPGYFLLGDNRDDSTDSRHFGSVAPDALLCKVRAIIASEANDWFGFGRTGLVH